MSTLCTSELFLCCRKGEFSMTSVFYWQNSVSVSFLFYTPRPNLPVFPYFSWLPTFACQSWMMKRTYIFGGVTHLESVILESCIMWALGSITTNTDSGGDGIPAELFKILKCDAVKVIHSYVRKFGKLSSSHRTEKGQFSFQSQRRATPENVHMIEKLCWKSFNLYIMENKTMWY